MSELQPFQQRVVDEKAELDDKITKLEAFMATEQYAKGLTGPRITPQHIEEQIVHSQYFQFPGTTVTVCCLTLRNGYNTVGESACVDPKNFDADVGRKIAYENAKQKIWALEGYLLRDFLHANREQAPSDYQI
jgi:Phage protein (N4 Gp49/phage Sf6 gene 66) family